MHIDIQLRFLLLDDDGGRQPASCCLVFRPQDVSVFVTAEDVPVDTNQMHGTVKSREFLGSTIRYRVDIRGDRVFADVKHQKGRLLFGIGTGFHLYVRTTRS